MKVKLLYTALLICSISWGQKRIETSIDHVSIGYGPMTFPAAVTAGDATSGGAAYLSIGGPFTFSRIPTTIGGTLFIGGDSRIQYGGEAYGSGMAGLAVFQDAKIGRDFRLGIFVGGLVFQTYEKVDDIINRSIREQSGLRPLPELADSNLQAFGGIKIGWKFIEAQYTPAGQTLTFGFKLL